MKDLIKEVALEVASEIDGNSDDITAVVEHILDRGLAELTAELQSTRLQMITDFGQYQEAHEKVKELTAEVDSLKSCMANVEATHRLTLREVQSALMSTQTANDNLTAEVERLKAELNKHYRLKPEDVASGDIGDISMTEIEQLRQQNAAIANCNNKEK